jgi:tetratricopeptide (TPR) repeat protein
MPAELDNLTICYQAIQRVYRNAVVEHVRQSCGADAVPQVQSIFKDKWEEMLESATQARASGEFNSELEDDLDIIGVEHFSNIFENLFDRLFPVHVDRPRKDKALAKNAILSWSRSVKAFRDPLSHPSGQDVPAEDAGHILMCARKILDELQLFEQAKQIQAYQQSISDAPDRDLLSIHLPPADEVVVDFIGRKPELIKLRHWLEDSLTPRWVLAGDGGKGKSSIAYSLAREVVESGGGAIQVVIWLSAKVRRFLQGQTVKIDRPDFVDRASVVQAILRAFGDRSVSEEEDEDRVRNYMREFPALLVIDDLDTLEGEGIDAVQFLFDLVVNTPSKLLITSREPFTQLQPCTTVVAGLNSDDARRFVASRCSLMNIQPATIMPHLDKLLSATDSSPLYIEDLLRLTLVGLSIQEAIGVWKQHRGDAARQYALNREFEKLPRDAQELLFVLSLMERPCALVELSAAAGWDQSRVVQAMTALQRMYLVQRVANRDGEAVHISLNTNTSLLVHKAFQGHARFGEVRRRVQGVLGKLRTTDDENRYVDSVLAKAHSQLKRCQQSGQEVDAEGARILDELARLESTYPGRDDIPGSIGWVYKKLGRITDARMSFKRAAEFSSRESQMYWHWADMETREGEYAEAVRVAEAGLLHAPKDTDLLTLLGEAENRLGRELVDAGNGVDATKLFKKSEAHLNMVLEKGIEAVGFHKYARAMRTMVLNGDGLKNGKMISECLEQWAKFDAASSVFRFEYQRMRAKYPEAIRPLEVVVAG